MLTFRISRTLKGKSGLLAVAIVTFVPLAMMVGEGISYS